jgi:hypothetical protein
MTIHALCNRSPKALKTIVLAAFYDAYEFSRRLEDASIGWQLFLTIDDAVGESLRALKMEYVVGEVDLSTIEAVRLRIEERFTLAIDVLDVLTSQGRPNGMPLMVALADKALDAYERIRYLHCWESEERELSLKRQREESDTLNLN